jgi:hypothetical protein
MTLNSEMKIMRKETILTYFKALSYSSHSRTKERCIRDSVGMMSPEQVKFSMHFIPRYVSRCT